MYCFVFFFFNSWIILSSLLIISLSGAVVITRNLFPLYKTYRVPFFVTLRLGLSFFFFLGAIYIIIFQKFNIRFFICSDILFCFTGTSTGNDLGGTNGFTGSGVGGLVGGINSACFCFLSSIFLFFCAFINTIAFCSSSI
eukprot:Lithocolla_globosa_v1_NODE_2843_length_1850_cov_299.708635.p2 type:complete len:140 gc:universal NODE_2843_length_1850_cov_299.708635:1382-1801(+)